MSRRTDPGVRYMAICRALYFVRLVLWSAFLYAVAR